MKYETKKIFLSLKEKVIEDEIKKISSDLSSQNALTVAISFDVLRRLKDRWHVEDAKVALLREEDVVVISAIRYLASCSYPLSIENISPLMKRGERVKKEITKFATTMIPDQARELLELLLEDGSSAVRIQAIRKIPKVKCADLVEKIKTLLEDQDFNVRIESAKALIYLGEDLNDQILLKMINDAKLPFSIRTPALKLYASHSHDALNVLKIFARSPYPKLSETALSLLSDFSCEENWELFYQILSNGSLPPEIIKSALKSASISCGDKTEFERLALEYVDHPSKDLKIASLKALILIGSQNVPGIMEKFLESDDRSLKLSVIPLIEFNPTGSAIEFIGDLLDSDDDEMIEKALTIFKKLKIKDGRIRDCLSHQNLKVRIRAFQTLVSLDEIEPDELVEIFRSERFIEMKLEALNGLSRIAPQRLEELS